MGSGIDFYVNTIHYLCIITPLYRISLYAAVFHTNIMDRLCEDFGWERLDSYNHVLFIINVSSVSEHNSSPFPQQRIRKRQDLQAFSKLYPHFHLYPLQDAVKPDIVRCSFISTILSAKFILS